MAERFDAIVIGAGQAGPALCARLDSRGLRTAIVERKLLGGTCVNVGCIPTKTLVGRAREMGETQGFMKVLVDADSKELLGAAILGLNGDEIVHSLLDIMYAKKPYTTIQRAVHIHPTVTELVPTLLGLLKPFQG